MTDYPFTGETGFSPSLRTEIEIEGNNYTQLSPSYEIAKPIGDPVNDDDRQLGKAYQLVGTDDNNVKQYVETGPSVDLRDSPNSEKPGGGLNHPAVLSDLNAIYQKFFNRTVNTGELKERFIRWTGILTRLRDNPSAEYGVAFKRWAEYSEARAEAGARRSEIDVQRDAERESAWYSSLASLVDKYPQAFHYSERNIGTDPDHHNVLAFVRPTEADSSLTCFTHKGVVDIAAGNLRGTDLVDLARVIDPIWAKEYALNAQNSSFADPALLSLDGLRARIDQSDPERDAKMTIIDRLEAKLPRNTYVKAKFRFGDSDLAKDLPNDYTTKLSARLKAANSQPWSTELVPEVAPDTKSVSPGAVLVAGL